jgi:hypothetical protein
MEPISRKKVGDLIFFHFKKGDEISRQYYRKIKLGRLQSFLSGSWFS